MKKLPQTPEEWRAARAGLAEEIQNDATNLENHDVLAAYTEPADWLDKKSAAYKELSAKEVESDWENLRRHAIVTFPEGRNHPTLNGAYKLIIVAHALGWSNVKISRAAGCSEGMVARILKRPDAKVFLAEYNVRNGDQDPSKLLSEGAYLGLKLGISILKDIDSTESMKRLKLDAAKWLVERKYGKPNQPIEHKGPGLAEVFKNLGAQTTKPLTEEEEADLFDPKH